MTGNIQKMFSITMNI